MKRTDRDSWSAISSMARRVRVGQGCARAAPLPVVTAHGLRGSHASFAMACGTTARIVAGTLGHRSESMTLRACTSADAVAAGMQRRVLAQLAATPPANDDKKLR